MSGKCPAEGRTMSILCCFLGWVYLACQQLNLFPSVSVIS